MLLHVQPCRLVKARERLDHLPGVVTAGLVIILVDNAPKRRERHKIRGYACTSILSGAEASARAKRVGSVYEVSVNQISSEKLESEAPATRAIRSQSGICDPTQP